MIVLFFVSFACEIYTFSIQSVCFRSFQAFWRVPQNMSASKITPKVCLYRTISSRLFCTTLYYYAFRAHTLSTFCHDAYTTKHITSGSTKPTTNIVFLQRSMQWKYIDGACVSTSQTRAIVAMYRGYLPGWWWYGYFELKLNMNPLLSNILTCKTAYADYTKRKGIWEKNCYTHLAILFALWYRILPTKSSKLRNEKAIKLHRRRRHTIAYTHCLTLSTTKTWLRYFFISIISIFIFCFRKKVWSTALYAAGVRLCCSPCQTFKEALRDRVQIKILLWLRGSDKNDSIQKHAKLKKERIREKLSKFCPRSSAPASVSSERNDGNYYKGSSLYVSFTCWDG